MAVGETTNSPQTGFQNYANVAPYAGLIAAGLLGRAVIQLPGPLAVGLVALGALAKGANAFGYNTWRERVCNFDPFGNYNCWLEMCHLEEVCYPILGGWFEKCYQEKVCY